MNKIIPKILLLLLITVNVQAEERITITTKRGRAFENVRVIDNSPDQIIVTNSTGLHTIRKEDLDDESKKLVGYDRDEDLKAQAQKKKNSEDYAAYLAQKNKEDAEKEKIERAKKLENDRLRAIAAAEAAQASRAESYRRYLIEEARRKEREKEIAAEQAVLLQQIQQRQQVEEAERQRQAILDSQRRLKDQMDQLQRQQDELRAQERRRRFNEQFP